LTPADGGVFIAPVSGGPERRVGTVYADRLGIKARHLDWSPDGKSLVVDDKGGPQESVSLFLLSIASGERRRLTSAPGRSSSDLAPRFSPDGAQIAFIRSASANVRDIYVVPASGGDPRRVTSDARWVGDLDWTSDGRAIVFSSDRSGIPSLWKISSIASGRVAKPVQISPSGEDAAYLSVDKLRAGKRDAGKHGSRLAYSQPTVNSDIWKLDLSQTDRADGGWTKLMGSAWEMSAPEYSRDGKKVLYRIDAPGNRQFWISDSDGRNQVALKSLGSPHSVDWSPDSQSLTFDVHENGHFGVFVASVTGDPARRLTTAEADDEYPRWSPDGKYIYFSSNRSGHWQIWRVLAAGGPAAQVTWQGGYGGRVSPDGQTLYYSKHQSLAGVWSVPTAGGEEVLVLNDVKPEHWGLWTLAADGIYFVDNGAPGSLLSASLKFFKFSTRQVTTLATTPKPVMLTGSFNLSLSDSGHSLILPLMDQASSDIVLVDNFR
jgi:Tol biopolymer transport system component